MTALALADATRPCIVGLGACTAVGAGARASVAAARAGIVGFREHPYMVDARGEPIVMSPAAYLDDASSASSARAATGRAAPRRAAARAEALAVLAADEALRAFEPGGERPLPALARRVVVPADRPGFPRAAADAAGARLAERWEAALGPGAATVEAGGHAAGLAALGRAAGEVAAGDVEACLVVAFDSYIDRAALEWIDGLGALHAPANAWGFVPGEAAGAVVVASRRAAAQAGLPVLAELRGWGAGVEENLIRTDCVCTGRGLIAAVRAALGGLDAAASERVGDVFCDGNGERYRAEEWGFCQAALAERFSDPDAYAAPAQAWGDVGAASGPLLVAAAVLAAEKGYARGRHALVFAGSDSGERAALLLACDVRPRWRA